jgi:hypothetical protein
MDMRTHAAYPGVRSWWTAPGVAAAVESATLAAARFELVAHAGVDCGWLDLLFQRGEQAAVLPGILVDLAAAAKGAAALQWPQTASFILSDDQAQAIAAVVSPWLRRLTQQPVIPFTATFHLQECSALETVPSAADFGAASYAVGP